MADYGNWPVLDRDGACDTSAMNVGERQGWYPDPFELHEARYFSAGRATKLVRDGRADSYDPPPSEDSWPEPAAAGTAGPGSAQLGSDGLAGSYPPGGDARLSLRDIGAGSATPAPPRRSNRAALIGPAVVAVGAVVMFVAIAGPRSPRAAPRIAYSPAAYVTASAQRTLGQQTVQVTLSGTLQAGGQAVGLQGIGEMDFTASSMAMAFTATSARLSMTEKERLVNRNIYVEMTVNGHNLVSVTGGRHWIRVPVPAGVQSAHDPMTGSNALAELALLKQHGISVRSLGMKSIAGQSCTGYAVTLPGQAGAGAQVDVCIDSHQLLRQLTIAVHINLGTAGSFGGHMVMNFTHYGAPVRIVAPSPSDTVSFQQFLNNLGSHKTGVGI